MDNSSIVKNLQVDNMSHDEQMALLDSIQQSIKNSKVKQKERANSNAQLVVQALKKIKQEVETRFDELNQNLEEKGKQIVKGAQGLAGRDGKDGKDGKQGINGRDGRDGKNGVDGQDGVDGISVIDAKIDFDGSLVITLSTGKELNVGEVVAPDIAEKIKLVTSGGAGISESGVATLTNKRINPRDVTATTATTLTPDVSVGDIYCFTALASALTINAPIGTPTNGEKLIFRLLDNGTSRALTWNATYTVIGVTLPTATTISKTTYVGCIYNANNTRWDVIAVTTEA
jgi:hypothetical protein